MKYLFLRTLKTCLKPGRSESLLKKPTAVFFYTSLDQICIIFGIAIQIYKI